jgi:hypothetical protein
MSDNVDFRIGDIVTCLATRPELYEYTTPGVECQVVGITDAGRLRVHILHSFDAGHATSLESPFLVEAKNFELVHRSSFSPPSTTDEFASNARDYPPHTFAAIYMAMTPKEEGDLDRMKNAIVELEENVVVATETLACAERRRDEEVPEIRCEMDALFEDVLDRIRRSA